MSLSGVSRLWRYIVLSVLVSLSSLAAQAATYNLSNGSYPPCSNYNNIWSISGSTYTCSATVTLASGDKLLADASVTVVAKAGFTLNNNTIGSADKVVNLSTSYGEINATGTEIYGSVTGSSGQINLSGTQLHGSLNTASGVVSLSSTRVSGSVTGTGNGSITSNSTVEGHVQFDNGLTATDAVLKAGITVNNGSVALTRVSVQGDIYAANGFVSDSTNINGSIKSSNGNVKLTGGSVQGDIYAANGLVSNGTDINGSINSPNGTITLNDGNISGNITGGCCKITLNKVSLTGSVSLKRNNIELTDSKVIGNIATTNTVSLTRAVVYGDVTAATWNDQTIKGADNSYIYGHCTPTYTTPKELCLGGGGGTPVDCGSLVGNQGFLVNVPDFISGDKTTATVQAVIKDEDGNCVTAFGKGAREVTLSSSYINPSTPSVGNYSLILPESPISLDFSAQGSASFPVGYLDAGKMSLTVHYEDNSGLVLNGAGDFIVTPARFSVEAPDAPVCNDPASTLCDKFVPAGDSFQLEVKALNILGGETPNFEYNSVLLEVSSIDGDFYPHDGVVPTITPGQYVHKRNLRNVLENSSINEVGVVKIKATAKDYLEGGRDVEGSSGFIGRFIPAYLDLNLTASLSPACGSDSGPFTYQGQWMNLTEDSVLILSGKNRQGFTTYNYRLEKYWRFNNVLEHSFFSATGRSELDESVKKDAPGILCSDADSRDLCKAVRVESTTRFGDPTMEVEGRSYPFPFSDHRQIRYLQSDTGPRSNDVPFAARLRLFISRDHLEDQDGAFYSQDKGITKADFFSGDSSFDPQGVITGSEIRLGRVRVENVIEPGVDNPPIARMPLLLEHWGVNGFAQANDTCTMISYEADSQDTYTYGGNLTKAEVLQPVELSDGAAKIQAEQWIGSNLNGFVSVKHLLRVQGSNTAPIWLCRESAPVQGGVCTYTVGSEEQARADATATFGVYQGSKPLIFRREVYR